MSRRPRASFPLASDAYPPPSIDALERLFLTAPLGALPTGLVRGSFLGYLDTPGARRLHVRAMDTVLFRAVRWGLDLDACVWWFEHPRLRAGRFRLVEGPSRWRDTRVLQVHYDRSRLPRGILYDELKPLEAGRILGMGGLDAPRGEGDHFFFELTPYGAGG